VYPLGPGTGLAPWVTIVRDPDTYERFEKVIVVHGVREVKELAYQELFEKDLPNHELLGEIVRDKLIYYPTVTREPFRNQGRITDLISDGTFPANIGLPPLDPLTDRVMLCGSPAMLADLKVMLEKRDFEEGNTSTPGDFVVERAFVEK
jgi:ferredoxin--NADP+ reductase